jgi:hypothetical protein
MQYLRYGAFFRYALSKSSKNSTRETSVAISHMQPDLVSFSIEMVRFRPYSAKILSLAARPS